MKKYSTSFLIQLAISFLLFGGCIYLFYTSIRLNKEVTSLKNEVQDQESVNKKLKRQISDLEDDKNDLDDKIQDLEDRVDDLENRKITVTYDSY